MIDLVLILLIVLLSLKGFFNGFLREMVGFVGLIGGVFVASRAALPVGHALGEMIDMDNIALLKLAGFLLTLALIWGGSIFVGTVFSSLRSEPHSDAGRYLGVVVAGLKYILVFSMIAASLFNNTLIHDNFAKSLDSSRLFPVFNKMGSKLTNISQLQDTMVSSTRVP